MFIKSQENKSMFVSVFPSYITHTHTHTHPSIQTHPHVPELYTLALRDFTIAEGTCLHSPLQYSGSKCAVFLHSFIPQAGAFIDE